VAHSDTPLVVLTTTASREEAEKLASSLVDARAAACVQIIPGIESFYSWEGRVARDAECLLLCKTTNARYPELEQAILSAHSYTTPEIIALPVERGSAGYLDWLLAGVGGPGPGAGDRSPERDS
jgi:periplasmic divalent cation tolerance protein